MLSYVYIQSERPSQHNDWRGLWTVGFFDPRGEWTSESDHGSADEAAARVHYLNGSNAAQDLLTFARALNHGLRMGYAADELLRNDGSLRARLEAAVADAKKEQAA